MDARVAGMRCLHEVIQGHTVRPGQREQLLQRRAEPAVLQPGKVRRVASMLDTDRQPRPREDSMTRETDPVRRSGLVAVMAILVMLASGCTTDIDEAPEAAASSPAPGADGSAHDAATRDDAEFNRVFSHEFADVADVQMH